jgi:hypothetical protein
MYQLTTDFTERIPVARLLRCRRTQRYFNAGTWTQDLNQAERFSGQFEVVRDCIRYDLREVELVLRAPGGHTDLFAAVAR